MAGERRQATVRHPPARRGQGQWAHGYTEPLNKTEQIKLDSDGLEVRARIESVYSKRGFGSIWPDDLRSRFRWWGLYTQRRQGVPGGRTAITEPHELEDKFFMLRGQDPGRAAVRRSAARDRVGLGALRAGYRRRNRSPERPASLGAHRRRAAHLGGAGEGWADNM